ncbi:hypothetical protein PIB30_075799 [Stylosanthes scabra]|uniref:Replication protein A 70 kDa DNA-binding subunit B/D first OB fold domain-containing protein n=1 Tax=Stylosanthes scabra TaxID=79078 RepID=A0ABU6TT12_9FABA|nr:hypothetical protein [Stylosanthes scabra]
MGKPTSSSLLPSGPKLALDNLNPWNEYKQIIVRLCRLWTLRDSASEIGEVGFLQGLFVDDSFIRVQFSVNKDNVKHFLDILKEGATYSISIFIGVPNVGTLKVTRHRYNLFLSLDTEVILLPDVTIPRPPHTLELIENVVEMEQDSPYLIVYVHCNLFGNFFNKLKFALINSITHPPILLLESISKITVNPDIQEIVAFINRIDPSKPYFLDHVSVKNCSIVACFDDEFLQLSQNRTIS